jgi:hypothetical protein
MRLCSPSRLAVTRHHSSHFDQTRGDRDDVRTPARPWTGWLRRCWSRLGGGRDVGLPRRSDALLVEDADGLSAQPWCCPGALAVVLDFNGLRRSMRYCSGERPDHLAKPFARFSAIPLERNRAISRACDLHDERSSVAQNPVRATSHR